MVHARPLILLTVMLLAGSASAETCERGRCIQWTADRIIARERLRCVYGRPYPTHLPDGRWAIVTPKVCHKERVR